MAQDEALKDRRRAYRAADKILRRTMREIDQKDAEGGYIPESVWVNAQSDRQSAEFRFENACKLADCEYWKVSAKIVKQADGD